MAPFCFTCEGAALCLRLPEGYGAGRGRSGGERCDDGRRAGKLMKQTGSKGSQGREEAGVEEERKKERWRYSHISEGTITRHASCGLGLNKYPRSRDAFRHEAMELPGFMPPFCKF